MRQPAINVQDESMVSMLYRRHAGVIVIYVRRLVSSWEDAEDIVLDVFVAALEQEKRLAELSDQAQLAWLKKVAHNKVVDFYRQSSRTPLATIDAVSDWLSDNNELTPEQMALQQETYAFLHGHLASLSQAQQEVLRLRFEAGLRCKDIAIVLNKREGTVRSLLSRSLNFLRKVYQEESGG